MLGYQHSEGRGRAREGKGGSDGVRMYVCMCVSECVCVFTCVCAFVCVYVCRSDGVCGCGWCMCMCLLIGACVYVCVCAVCVCVRVVCSTLLCTDWLLDRAAESVKGREVSCTLRVTTGYCGGGEKE